jgi:hypothetical protein
MQFRHPESYRILLDGRILQDPMGSGIGYVDLGENTKHTEFQVPESEIRSGF